MKDIKRYKEYQRAYQKEYRIRNKHRASLQRRNCSYKRLYGITLLDYQDMLVNQHGVCAICGGRPDLRLLHVDHCHATGKVRALLCVNCNTALANFDDSPQLMRKAADYIDTFAESTGALADISELSHLPTR